MSVYIFNWINFAILAVVLFVLLRKKLGDAFRLQRENLERQMKEAGAEYAAMKEEFERVSKATASLKEKSEEMRAAFKREIDYEAKRLELETERMISRLSADAEAQMHAEVEKAKSRLQREVFDSALQSARGLLQREFQSKDSEWISELSQSEQDMNRGTKNYAS